MAPPRGDLGTRPEQRATPIPGASDITKAAGPLLGGSPLKSLADVNGVFSKLGLSPEMVSKFAPIPDRTGKQGGRSTVAGLLGSLFK